MAGAATTLSATYINPFEMHGSIGPSCAVADVQGDKATIWSGTQDPHGTKASVGQDAGHSAGQRARDERRSLWLLWSQRRRRRHDRCGADVAAGWQTGARPVHAPGRASLGAEGSGDGPGFPGWRGRGRQRGRLRPHGVDSATLRLDESDRVSWSAFRSASPSRATCRTGRPTCCTPSRTSRSSRTSRGEFATAIRTAYLRGPAWFQYVFAKEAFADELAAAAHRDPIEFRMAYLTDQRLKDALQAVAQAGQLGDATVARTAGGG